MAGEVGTAFVRVRPNISGFQAEASSGLTRAVKGIALAVGGAFAAQKILSFGKSAVQTAADIQKSTEFINQSFGKQAKAVTDFGEKAAGSFLLSSKESDAFSATIGRLAQQNGIGSKTAANMSIQLQKLAGSFGEIKGQDPAPMLDALSRALIGNTRGLKQMGIAVNATNELQAAERLGFIKTTVDANKVAEAHARVAEYTKKVADETKKYGATSSQTLGAVAELKGAQDGLSSALAGKSSSTVTSLTAAQKAQVIMAVATQHLSELQKQASQHSGDLADQQIRLTKEWSNAKDEVGVALLPAVTKLSTVFAKNLPGAMQEFSSALKQGIGDVKPLVPPLVAAFTDLFNLIRDHKGLVLDLVGGLIAFKVASRGVSEATKIAREVQAAYNTVMSAGRVLLGTATAEQDAATAVQMANTAALEANTAAMTGNAAAMEATNAAKVQAIAETDVLGVQVAALSAEIAAQGTEMSVAEGATLVLADGVTTLGEAVSVASAELGVYQAALARTAEAEVALGVEQAALDAEIAVSAGGLETFGAGLVAMAGGPAVVAGVAIAGLVGGLAYFVATSTGPVEAAMSNLGSSLNRLAGRLHAVSSARKDLTANLRQIPEEKLAVQQAHLNVEQARSILHNKALNKTTLERKQNELNLKEALWQLRGAQQALNATERAANKDEQKRINATKQLAHLVHEQTVPAIEKLIGADRSHLGLVAALNEGVGRGITVQQREHDIRIKNTQVLHTFLGQLSQQRGELSKGNPLLSHNIALLEQFARHIGRIPTKHETEVILRTDRLKTGLRDIDRLLLGVKPKVGRDGDNIGISFIEGVRRGMQDRATALSQSAQQHMTEMKVAAKSIARIKSPSDVWRVEIGQPLIDGVIQGLRDRQPALSAQLRHGILSEVQSSAAWAKQIGQAIVGGVEQPIPSLGAGLGQAIVDAANAAIAHARSVLKISSPSQLFAKQVGRPIADGILHGMGGLKAGLVSQITTAAKAAASAAGGIGATPGGSAATGANERLGQQMMLRAGFAANQWGALQALWTRESGWNQFAKNASSGAYGIPQSLPASKMASAGNDWMTNPATQIAWGLSYIRSRYGDPAGAWAHEGQFGWYDQGGVVPGRIGQPQIAVVHGGETILPTHKDKHAGGVNIDQLTVVTSSPHLWGQASDVVNAIARRVQR